MPSGRPMRASCATTPACVWNSPPSTRVTRWRRFLLSVSNTRSPATNAPRGASVVKRALDRHRNARAGRACLQSAERAHRLMVESVLRLPFGRLRTSSPCWGGCAATDARLQVVLFFTGVGREPVVAPLEEPEQERRLRPGRTFFDRVQRFLVT